MTRQSLVVILCGAATMSLRALGPGIHRVPRRLREIDVRLVTAALLGGLIATQVFASGQRLALDARAVALVVAATGAARGWAPTLIMLGTVASLALARRVFG